MDWCYHDVAWSPPRRINGRQRGDRSVGPLKREAVSRARIPAGETGVVCGCESARSRRPSYTQQRMGEARIDVIRVQMRRIGRGEKIVASCSDGHRWSKAVNARTGESRGERGSWASTGPGPGPDAR